MKLTILLFLALLSVNLTAQNLPLPGAKWFGTYHMTSDPRVLECHDTIIEGNQCIEIKQYYPYKNGEQLYLSSDIFHDSSGIVTFYKNGAFYPYFNFNLIKGDTFQTFSDTGLVDVVVDSVYNLQGLKHYLIKRSGRDPVLFIQKVFKISFPETLTDLLWFNGAAAQIGTEITCYTDNINSYETHENSRCGFSFNYYPIGLEAEYHISKFRNSSDSNTPYFRLKYKNGRMQYIDQNGNTDAAGDVQLQTTGGKTYAKDNGEWVLLYDFGAKTGDTITTRAVIKPLLITNNATGYRNIASYRYIIDSVYQSLNVLYQIPKSIPGEKWEMPGILRDDMGSTIALLGQPVHNDQTGKSGYVRCFSGQSRIPHWNFEEVKRCDALFLSLDEKERLNRIEVYPNPSKGIINVNIGEVNKELHIQISDLSGRLLITKKLDKNSSHIDASSLQTGLYLLLIQTDNAQVLKKIIIE